MTVCGKRYVSAALSWRDSRTPSSTPSPVLENFTKTGSNEREVLQYLHSSPHPPPSLQRIPTRQIHPIGHLIPTLQPSQPTACSVVSYMAYFNDPVHSFDSLSLHMTQIFHTKASIYHVAIWIRDLLELAVFLQGKVVHGNIRLDNLIKNNDSFKLVGYQEAKIQENLSSEDKIALGLCFFFFLEPHIRVWFDSADLSKTQKAHLINRIIHSIDQEHDSWSTLESTFAIPVSSRGNFNRLQSPELFEELKVVVCSLWRCCDLEEAFDGLNSRVFDKGSLTTPQELVQKYKSV